MTKTHPTRKRRTILEMMCMTVLFSGIQSTWSVQIAFSSPTLLSLGISKSIISIIWIIGPISGLVVQPIVGSVSDIVKWKIGRRRPFIFGGMVCVLIGLALFACSEYFVDYSRNFAIFIAIFGLAILDFGNNGIQAPTRALTSDLVEKSQQTLINSFLSVFIGLGSIFGYFLSSLENLDMKMSFLIVGCYILFVTVVTISTTKENENNKNKKETNTDEPVEIKQFQNPFRELYRVIKKLPSEIRRICLFVLFLWASWFPFLIYSTSYFAIDVYKGSEDKDSKDYDKYQQGVHQGSSALMYMAITTFVFSMLISKIEKKIGVKYLLIFSCFLQSFSFSLISIFQHKVISLIMVILLGIPYSLTNSIPFSLLAQHITSKKSGVYMGVLNCFIVLAQFWTALVAGPIIKACNNQIAMIFWYGAGFAFIALITVFFIKLPKRKSSFEEFDSSDSDLAQLAILSHSEFSDHDTLLDV
ncbi:hypothetical protein M0813_13693 [Anaeramoeba flamelloides]|uniref:Sucrose transporter n=1 Tax=Anaeramoeba flamelloides TaxID=1746091 RepID=A0ABQ8Z8J0_9EUKA|nr:hypothetical protein M0813_13693 [Anaeramoeba flamelloides]